MWEIGAIPNAQDLAGPRAADLLRSQEGPRWQSSFAEGRADALGGGGSPAPCPDQHSGRARQGQDRCSRAVRALPAHACAAGRAFGAEAGAGRAATWPRRNARARGSGVAEERAGFAANGLLVRSGPAYHEVGVELPLRGRGREHPWAADAGRGEGRSEGRPLWSRRGECGPGG